MDLREPFSEISQTHKTNEPPKRLLGDLLIRRGQIRRYQLEFLLELQDEYKRKNIPSRIGDLLVKHRAIKREVVEAAALIQKEVPFDSVTDIVNQLREVDEISSQTKVLPDFPD